jgi:hypothetical protein
VRRDGGSKALPVRFSAAQTAITFQNSNRNNGMPLKSALRTWRVLLFVDENTLALFGDKVNGHFTAAAHFGKCDGKSCGCHGAFCESLKLFFVPVRIISRKAGNTPV